MGALVGGPQVLQGTVTQALWIALSRFRKSFGRRPHELDRRGREWREATQVPSRRQCPSNGWFRRRTDGRPSSAGSA
jgi:hypothetical protein